MGGTALKNSTIHRMPKDEYIALGKKVTDAIRDLLDHHGYIRRCEVIRSYHTKQDFGDLDVLMESNELHQDWINILRKEFNSKEVVPNGDVVSFEVDGCQVDIIKSPIHEFDAASTYFAYNDLGNFMGKLTRRMNVKYGHDGMWYVFRDGTQVIKNICISREPGNVFHLLQLDKSKFDKGFDTMEDVFEFVATSPYFSPTPFAFENMNTIARVRDKKRKSYNMFLKWIEDNKATRDWNFEFNRDKDSYLPMLFKMFPYFREDWYAARHQMFDMREYKSKFNGQIVSRITGLSGKELGQFMSSVKPSFDIDFVLTQNESVITNMIEEKFKEHK